MRMYALTFRQGPVRIAGSGAGEVGRGLATLELTGRAFVRGEQR
jgi:hypothetical protein